jgi:hypothetical protein
MLSALICRLTNHIVRCDDFAALLEVRCSRCNALLSQPKKAQPEEDLSLKPKSYTRGCVGKTRFSSHAQAVERMARMKCRPATLHPYYCYHCEGYHLGNSKPKYR